MKYYNANSVQVAVQAKNGDVYYMPPKSFCEINYEINDLPKGVKLVNQSKITKKTKTGE